MDPMLDNESRVWGGPVPALHLWPLQNTFSVKFIHLPDHHRVKIGRQTNNKTAPGERNAYFDSKVLSRTHAEIWQESSKIYIKDLRSSNGTFVNGDRLSPEGVESEAWELKSEDVVEFGIDIVSDDNRTIVHHKVAAKVYCVLNADDGARSAKEMSVNGHQDNRGPRRPAALPIGAHPPAPHVTSAGGKAISFEHVLQKLQAELTKSKDTGTELQSLASSMGEIQDTLSGGMPPSQNGSASQFIPTQYRSTSAETQAALAGPHGRQAAAFINLQNQLAETQTSLSGHLEKIRNLEDHVQDNEATRQEISQVRSQMEETKKEMDLLLANTRGRQRRSWSDDDDDGGNEGLDDDDDDAKSVATITADDLTSERSTSRRKKIGKAELLAQNADLAARVERLTAEMTDIAELSKSLKAQHGEAMSAVETLAARLGTLETGFASRVAEEVGKNEQRWEQWRLHFEDTHKKDRETWDAERERLRGVVREWEEASRRAHEEEEERELNEELSGDEPDTLVHIGPDVWTSDKDASPNIRSSRRIRRRRPSQRASLAIDALKAVADGQGTATPKQAGQTDDAGARRRRDGLRAAPHNLGHNELMRSGSTSTLKGDSSESGKESGDTVQEGGESQTSPKLRGVQPIPIFTVLVVAVVAGALIYKNKD